MNLKRQPIYDFDMGLGLYSKDQFNPGKSQLLSFFLFFNMKAKEVKKILPQISEAITECNDVGQVWFGPFHCYLGAGTPESAKTILASSGRS